jgi:RNase P subunit RPR2
MGSKYINFILIIYYLLSFVYDKFERRNIHKKVFAIRTIVFVFGGWTRLRCPNCGRYSKVHIKKRRGGEEIVSVCSYCGEINLYSEKSVEKTGRPFDYLKIILIITTIVFAGVSTFLYYRSRALVSLDVQYTELTDDYSILLNISDTLREYYDNTRTNYSELQIMYQDLRQEYSDLLSLHSGSIQENTELMDQISQLNLEKDIIQKELDDMLSFSKSTIIENNSSYVILPGGNTTLTYNIVYAGYIEVNFTSTTDIFLWIGSPVSEDTYYFRFPAFPHTVFNGTFIVPVSNAVFLFMENTNVELSGEVIISIKYIY